MPGTVVGRDRVDARTSRASHAWRRGRFPNCGRARAESMEPRLLLATFTVTTTADAGAGSLRQAILDANGSGEADVIRFNIPGTGLQTIRPASPLPVVVGPTEINGRTQPGTQFGELRIELDGSMAGPNADGLTFSGGGGTLRSVAVNRFGRHGIVLVGAGGNTVESCYVGTSNHAGIGDLGNGGSGIAVLDSPDNIINATAWGSSDFMVIGGNGRYGVEIIGPGSVGNVVDFNIIGAALDSVTPVPNDLGGVLIDNATDTLVGSDTEPRFSASNVISGNRGPGIVISGAGASGNFVGSNAIGVDYLFQRVLGNAGEGILIRDGAHNNRVGDLSSSAAYGGNVIGGNGGSGGIRITGPGTTRNAVRGNFIGTDFAGTAPFGNGPRGVGVLLDAPGNVVGGSDPATGNFGANRIAFNKTGVGVSAGSGNTITENSIYSNENLGIDLNMDGVTPNDGDASDVGPNHLQDFPVLSDAAQATTAEGVPGTRVRGTLNSTPNTTFRLHFYSSVAPDTTAYGEGQTYRGAADVTTDAAGEAAFDVVVFARQPNTGDPGKPAPAGEWATATATAPGGSTSEFSRAVRVGGVVARRVFYNNSAFDGRDPAATAADDNAIVPGRQVLLPQSGEAEVLNYSDFTGGINGIMVDLFDLPATTAPLTADDFSFKQGGTNFPQGYQPAPPPTQVTVRRGAGAGGSDRVTLAWASGAVRNAWLQVTVLANGRTGLSVPDVFYFGNLVGDTFNESQRAPFTVNSLDLATTRQFLNRAAVSINDIADHNHDGRVNSLDLAAVKANLNRQLARITPTIFPPPGGVAFASALSSTKDSEVAALLE